MGVQKIRLLGDEVLRTVCEPVTRFTGAELKHIATDLSDTLGSFRITKGFGRGIAAPQIGSLRRVIVLNVDGPRLLVNPVIKRRSREQMTLWDDCFSFPDLMVKVKRHARVTVEYQDFSGSTKSLTAVGDTSELLQHEIDHLDGILAIDRAIDSRHIILRSEWEKTVAAHRRAVAL
jgi:peptide deformylase